jgi:nitrogen fixation NifU-like protein
MSDLRDLYQEVILDHSRNPRHHHALGEPACHAEGHNPLCGDRVTIYARVENGTLADVSFEGGGCAISTASASLMADALKGVSVEEVATIHDQFHALLTGRESARDRLGKLSVFAGVAEFPIRVKCATLAWHTLRAALAGARQPVSTEGER